MPIQGANTYYLICNKCLHQAFVEVQYHVNVICINKCLAYPSEIYDIGYGGQNMYANVKTISIFSFSCLCPLSRCKSLPCHRWGTWPKFLWSHLENHHNYINLCTTINKSWCHILTRIPDTPIIYKRVSVYFWISFKS